MHLLAPTTSFSAVDLQTPKTNERTLQSCWLERMKAEKTESRMKVHRKTNGLTGHFCAHHVCFGPPPSPPSSPAS